MTVLTNAPAVTVGAAVQRELYYRFLAGQVGADALPEPGWGPIGKEVFERTYSRDVTGPDGTPRKETFAEMVRRVVLGNLSYAPADSHRPGEDVDLFDMIYNLRAVPAGRHLWVTGTNASQWSRNCWVSGWTARTADHFRFAAARLFEGGGVGSNYSNDLLAVTEPIRSRLNVEFTCRADHPDIDAVRSAAGDAWIDDPRPSSDSEADLELNALPFDVEYIAVADTREDWVTSWGRLIDLATLPELTERIVVDVSDLRPYGTPLRTFGGQASGPAPFVEAAAGLVDVLNRAVGRRLSSVEAMEIDHHIASSVVAGGARRSARMSLKNWSDPDILDFIMCKADQKRHWTTNISVEIDAAFREALDAGDSHALAVLRMVSVGMAANGEPGLVDTEAHSIGEAVRIRNVNPCGEASLSTDGAEGESCNLGSVDLDAFGTDIEGAVAAFDLMARFLYRATLNPHQDPTVGRIERRNRRIGVGIMGLQGWMAAHGYRLSDLPGRPDMLEKLAVFRAACRYSADSLADELGLPRPVKVTAVAPTGTIAQLRGTTPGGHLVHARYFLRRVRYSENSPALDDLAAAGYRIVDDIYAERTKVVEFPVRDSILDRFDEELIEQADEVTADQFFAVVAALQGSFCGGSDGQAVSATAQIPAGSDPDRLAAAIRAHLGAVKGVTVFPDLSRDLAPLEALTKAEFDVLAAKVGAVEVGDSNDGACKGGACPIR